MSLAIFDLDNTLIGGDSDYLWGQYLVELGVVDRDVYERENLRFYEEYKAGNLDIHEFLRFSLKPLSQHPHAQLLAWRDDFMRKKIEMLMLPQAHALVRKHRDKGDVLLIITATNRFVTEPFARKMGVDHLLATDPEFIDGRFTGNVAGTPCFQHGKVERLDAWLQENRYSLEHSWFYSDSHNDLPLLQKVDNPVAVDADEVLTAYAREHGWPLISLR